jgi:ABC-type multidrug transport system fused ATPase/permease subunit
LNRFSKDIETIDSALASSLQHINITLASFLASLITVAVIFPWFLLPATIIGFAYFKLGVGYLNTGRDLRRMESNSRSPIFSGFAELLDGKQQRHITFCDRKFIPGIVTVRAFSAERQFLNNLFGKIDLTTRVSRRSFCISVAH